MVAATVVVVLVVVAVVVVVVVVDVVVVVVVGGVSGVDGDASSPLHAAATTAHTTIEAMVLMGREGWPGTASDGTQSGLVARW